MFKHNIEYVDFNGNERNEDFYFHLSIPEVTRLEARFGAPVDVYIKTLVENQELAEMLNFLEDIILTSYGRKTTDGKSFIKNQQLRTEFEYSQAYAELFEEMILNPELVKRFGEGVSETAKHRQKKNTVEPMVKHEDS